MEPSPERSVRHSNGSPAALCSGVVRLSREVREDFRLAPVVFPSDRGFFLPLSRLRRGVWQGLLGELSSLQQITLTQFWVEPMGIELGQGVPA